MCMKTKQNEKIVGANYESKSHGELVNLQKSYILAYNRIVHECSLYQTADVHIFFLASSYIAIEKVSKSITNKLALYNGTICVAFHTLWHSVVTSLVICRTHSNFKWNVFNSRKYEFSGRLTWWFLLSNLKKLHVMRYLSAARRKIPFEKENVHPMSVFLHWI